LAADLRPRHLDKIAARTVALEDLPGVFDAMLQGQARGRTVVKIADE
jgi:NADPH-dependent curcumin reductase CurA